MYDIKLLEEKWNKYNRKKRKPYYKWIVIVSLLALAVFATFSNKGLVTEFIESYLPMGNEGSKSVKIAAVVLDGPIDTLAIKESASPQLMTIAERKPQVKRVVNNHNPMDASDVFIDEDSTVKPSFSTKSKMKNRLNIEVTEMSGSSIYQDVEDRFQDAPETDDALFLAREYYSQHKYNKAAYWALQTNRLDGDIEESWLIFAKAKVKLGQKNEAIRVLSEYTRKSNSKAANTLLNKLRK